MTRLVIVADDLTGAADSAASLVARGTASVVLDAAADWPDDDVLAVDTDSRHRAPDDAAQRVAGAVRRARDAGAEVVKKIDSTLRGNLVVELRALQAVDDGPADRVLLVVAPAFPAAGRVTRGGVVHVGGRPLDAHESDGDVVALLRRGGLRVEPVPRPGSGAGELARRLERLDPEVDAVVVDADHDEDLAAVVGATRHVRRRTVLVGSGGLTRPLGDVGDRLGPERSPHGGAGEGPTLVVVGSYAAIARTQRLRLVAAGVAPVLLDDPATTVEALRTALAGGTAVLSPDPDLPVVRADAPRVARDLASVAGAVLRDVGTLVATGGETARAVLTVAGVSRLHVVGEVEPGVVRMHVPELGLGVVTKAGAFGDEHSLLRCLTGR